MRTGEMAAPLLVQRLVLAADRDLLAPQRQLPTAHVLQQNVEEPLMRAQVVVVRRRLLHHPVHHL